MKLEELHSRLGIQGDHGSLAVLIPDEHDSIADGQCPKGLPVAQSALDAVVRRPLPQDLSRTGIDGMNLTVDAVSGVLLWHRVTVDGIDGCLDNVEGMWSLSVG